MREVQALFNDFQNLSYKEKSEFLDKVIDMRSINSSDLSVKIMLISQCVGIYKIYQKKNPDVPMNIFIKKLMNIPMEDNWENRWIDNMCAFSEALTKNCTSINLNGSKTIPEFKEKIQAVLDLMLPF